MKFIICQILKNNLSLNQSLFEINFAQIVHSQIQCSIVPSITANVATDEWKVSSLVRISNFCKIVQCIFFNSRFLNSRFTSPSDKKKICRGYREVFTRNEDLRETGGRLIHRERFELVSRRENIRPGVEISPSIFVGQERFHSL